MLCSQLDCQKVLNFKSLHIRLTRAAITCLTALLEIETEFCQEGLIRTSNFDKSSGSTKITTHLDQIGHCETKSGSNWSNRRIYQVFIIDTRRD